jgi:hypothetical protein
MTESVAAAAVSFWEDLITYIQILPIDITLKFCTTAMFIIVDFHMF